MKSRKHFPNFAFLVLLCVFANPLLAAEYYVDQNHPSANDQNAGTTDRPWKTLTKANATLIPGDTVYIKAGTYNSYIAPSNSGTSSNRITYMNYQTDVVTVQDAAYGIWLDGKSYVTVQGINFYNLDRFMYLENSANYNIIAYCNFDQMISWQGIWGGSRIWYNSSYNWVHHCTFSNFGACISGQDLGGVLDIGWSDNSAYEAHYNLIENSTLYNGGHHVLSVQGTRNVIRNNYLYNYNWTEGKGNRTLGLGGFAATASRNLFEGNRFGYSDVPCDSWGASGVILTTWYNLFRYNSFFYNNLAGLELSCTPSYNSGPNYNKVYNNTFMHNGWQLDNGADDPGRTQVYFGNWSGGAYTIQGNIFKNNLFYDAPRVFSYNGSVSASNQIFANNYNGDASGDPRFVNATSTPGTPSDTSYPRLNLQSDSPVIDYGTYLTTVAVADTGTGTSLIVGEAGYFQDGGTWGPPNTSYADWIAVGTVGNIVQRSSINYSTNTITLASSITRNDNDPVWLYKKSDGVRVLFGSAPDVGAYEYSQTEAP